MSVRVFVLSFSFNKLYAKWLELIRLHFTLNFHSEQIKSLSGYCQLPIVPFTSPASLRKTINSPPQGSQIDYAANKGESRYRNHDEYRLHI